VIQRRDFITLLGGAAVAWPLAAGAQQRAVPVIGFLGVETPDVFADRVRAFRQGLSEAGFVEGRNVALVFQWAGGNYDLLPTLASELVRQRVSLVVTGGTAAAARAAKAATATIPTVFYMGGDPVSLGLVTSLARPGGNLTGVTPLATELLPKRIELLHEIVPAATSVAFMANPNSTQPSQINEVENSAQALGLALHVLRATTDREFESIFLKALDMRAGGLVISPDPLFGGRDEELAALLMSYGASRTDMFRVVGVYAGRILNGEKVANLPVQQATKVDLTLNMKTAKALGLTIPLTLLGRADEVIE